MTPALLQLSALAAGLRQDRRSHFRISVPLSGPVFDKLSGVRRRSTGKRESERQRERKSTSGGLCCSCSPGLGSQLSAAASASTAASPGVNVINICIVILRPFRLLFRIFYFFRIFFYEPPTFRFPSKIKTACSRFLDCGKKLARWRMHKE